MRVNGILMTGSLTRLPERRMLRRASDAQVDVIDALHKDGGAGGIASRLEANGRKKVMWMLVIILLSSVPGINPIIVLKTFATLEECRTERNRVGFEMAEAYPYDRDFVIACQLNRKQES